MVRFVRHVLLAAAAVLLVWPATALAQVGSISGTARDATGAVLPGVTVDVTSPQLIEKVRSATTDGNGRYQIINLPVGTYRVSFKLDTFSTVEIEGIELTSDFSAPVNASMKPGRVTEVVTVSARTNTVDIQNARQRQVFTGEELRDLPTTRDLAGLVNLVPGIAVLSGDTLNSVPVICGGGAGDDNLTGGQSGCTPLLGMFNSHSSMNDPWNTSLNRGRIQVDGMNIQGVGVATSQLPGGLGNSALTPYLADVQNAQEVTFTLSGGLGESDTGGATINIVPRTGGNRYAGNFFMSYGDGKFYDRNEGTRARTVSAVTRVGFNNQLDYDYDNNGSYGGPIVRDRLWFQAGARYRGRRTNTALAFHNLNEGLFGANYQRDHDRPSDSFDYYRNANIRLTLQASTRNKFNIFWDEQYTCTNPCEGATNATVSPEAQGSTLNAPLHVSQLNWTNPFTSRVLLDAGLSWNSTHVDQTKNRYLPAYPGIPRVVETGQTAPNNSVTSGSINDSLYSNNDRWETRASASYVTGSHNAKLGYQGQFLSGVGRPHYNDLQLQYSYATPGTAASSCVPGLTPPSSATAPLPGLPTTPATTTTWCGLLPGGMPNPNDHPDSLRDSAGRPTCVDANGDAVCRFPVPSSVTQYLWLERNEQVFSNSVYIQDQWTLKRWTLNGALRYDRATSRYNESCVGPDQFMGSRSFCLNSPDAGEGRNGEGVSFQDLTPRWGVVWDVFGNGRTSLKWNMGKYIGAAGIGGIYTASNAANRSRITTTFNRPWVDANGDRIVDCDLTIPAVAPPAGTTSIPATGECPAITNANSITNYRRFGRSPDDLDEANLAIGLGTIQCGRNDSTRIDPAILNYCQDYFNKGGSSLLSGWNKRQYEWQFGLGVQHELLPRMSVEVTYNRRWSKLQTLTDDIGSGCDLYAASADGSFEFGSPDECMSRFLDWNNPSYDFYGVRAPLDPGLPHGGGYLIPGFTDRKPGVATDGGLGVTAETLDVDGRRYSIWRGVDVNVTLRARGGLRMSGGTSTGGSHLNDCAALFSATNAGFVALREGRERACDRRRPLQTNLRGTLTYTIPWVDVLFSSAFSYRPGVQISANATFALADLEWLPGSEYRATNVTGCTATVAGVTQTLTGCLIGVGTSLNTATTVSQNLLSDDTFGEGIRLFDIKLAKNVRFGGKRLNLGADVYNLFNSDGATQYCATYPECTLNGALVPWKTITGLTSPRYARFQLQFDF
jgi:hypothetical protein